ncbi:MAG TPA: F0F1 ATP synthase subunit delta [Stellaceae bacterium]|nr:F0F1 ATP synthase subunit delta [Stellaceae bacterium]
MRFDWFTFALQTINFAILVWLLHRFLYKPVLRLIDERRAAIDGEYDKAHAAETAARQQLAKIEGERGGIATERTAALAATAHEAETAAAAIIAKAERDAAAVVEDARKTLAIERDQALAEARHAALDLGGDIARRLLAEMPPDLRAEAWIERIDRHLAALPPEERQNLAHQAANGARLEVVTASPLSPGAADAWHARLEKLLDGPAAIDFAVDPALVAGAELRFPNAVLRLSWQSALAAMRQQIDSDAHAG